VRLCLLMTAMRPHCATLLRSTLVVCRVGLAATILSAIVGEGAAQDGSLNQMLGTISVEAKPSFAGGQLNGCTVEFGVLARDWTYKQGAYIRVGGSFGLVSAKGIVSAMLKVILHDIDPRTLNFTPSPPTNAYFVSGTSTTKNITVGSYPSDVPGAIFVVFKLSPTFEIIAQGLADDKLTIAFARKEGGTDVQVTIDTSVVDTAANGQRTRSPQASLDFAKCARSLIQQATK
jgi:hypothetical protein